MYFSAVHKACSISVTVNCTNSCSNYCLFAGFFASEIVRSSRKLYVYPSYIILQVTVHVPMYRNILQEEIIC